MLRIAKKVNRSFRIVDLILDLIIVTFEKYLSPEQLVIIKERYILSLLKNTRSQSPKIHNLIDMIIAAAKYEILRKRGAPCSNALTILIFVGHAKTNWEPNL